MAEKNTPAKAAGAMIGYAVLMLGGGGAAYAMAPAGANATTALIVPGIAAGLMVLCAVMTLLLRASKPVGMIGIHLGLILPLVFAGGIIPRAFAAKGAVDSYNAVVEEHGAAIATGEIDESVPLETYIQTVNAERSEDEQVEDHDKSYLMYTLFALGGLSIAAFVVLLGLRPKAGDRGPAEG
ncbi:MAG: hypothetical protein AAFR38_13535 [Planctomycetota bacterium]